MNKSELEQTVKNILNGDKGILACDESEGTMGKRFEGRMENTADNRHGIRKTFFSAKLSESIGGVILHDETLRCKDTIKPLIDQSIVLGIKTDMGMKPLAKGTQGEQTTEHGLATLKNRSEEYYKLGARFAKWRAVVEIGQNMPSKASLEDVSDVLSEYALISQNAGLVPIIEPEVLQNGSHGISEGKKWTEEIITMTLNKSAQKGVHMPGALLKVNMVTKGVDCKDAQSVDDVAKMTNEVLNAGIGSHKLGGVVFLSGGLTEVDSADFLNKINVVKQQTKNHPECPFSFSYARANQKTAIYLYTTKAKTEDVQGALEHRCKMNHLAVMGKYSKDQEGNFSETAQKSNFIANNAY